jgi:outer membrane protein, multidrug efflux system
MQRIVNKIWKDSAAYRRVWHYAECLYTYRHSVLFISAVRISHGLSFTLLLTLLNGCAWVAKPLDGFRALVGIPPVQTTVKIHAPSAWQAPLPHEGRLTLLKAWWQQFNDPLLIHLIDAAQAVSPSIATAKSRIEQARAKQVSANAALLPAVNANGSVSRGLDSLFFPPATISSIGLATQWELDVFGANQAGRNAAQARLDGATAAWHDARVLLAAEVASQYNMLRSAEAQLANAQRDADSRAETVRLTEQLVEAGFQAPANAALAQASAAQASNTLELQSARCALAIKALVALTGEDEVSLRKQLQTASGKLAEPVEINVAAVPAEALAQRPDISAAAYEVIAASADITQLQAQRYPKISFSGKISAMNIELAVAPKGGSVWSVGPLAVTLPIFDGGLRVANVDAARAHYTEASINYAAKLRNAVREVEEALINLHSMQQRMIELEKAVDGYQTSFTTEESLYNGGLASLVELEAVRRSLVQAQNVLLDLRRERIDAWISLYRALGGGWNTADSGVADSKTALFK